KTHALLINGSANHCAGINERTSENLKNSVFETPVLPARKKASTGTNPCCLSQRRAVCAFCDKAMCSNCCRVCSLCSMEYCHLCSVLQ
ncbi:hypothetical protein AVEN_72066-1, partial [Araneus ventricosus]